MEDCVIMVGERESRVQKEEDCLTSWLVSSLLCNNALSALVVAGTTRASNHLLRREEEEMGNAANLKFIWCSAPAAGPAVWSDLCLRLK